MEVLVRIASPAVLLATKMATLAPVISDTMMPVRVTVWHATTHAKLPHALAQPAQLARVATLPSTEPMSPLVLPVSA